MPTQKNHPTRRPRGLFLLAAAVVVVAFVFGPEPSVFAQRTKPAPRKVVAAKPAAVKTSYYGVYMRDTKVGNFVLAVSKEKRDGVSATRADATMTMDLNVLGAASRILSKTSSWSDPSGRPLALESRTEAAGKVTQVSARFTPRSVTYTADIQGARRSDTLTLAPGEKFLADAGSGAAEIKPKPGLKMSGKVFSPDTMQLLDSEITVIGQEPVAVGGQTVVAWKATDKNSIAPSTLWLTEDGDLLRQDSLLGMQVRREPKAMALAGAVAGSKQVDLAAVIAITPTGVELETPRTTRAIEYQITGLTKKLGAKDDSIQKMTYEPDGAGLKATVTVTTRPLPDGPTVPLYKKPADAPEALRPYLKSTLYVPADSPQFKALAKQVVGDETDAAKAAAKIADYVHKFVKPDPGIAALRTAADIVKTPRGVCRDYTTLYAAIARASGLATKQCVGIAFFQGKFYYHAWPEVWVGDDTWIALEPTWGAPFADATHIKLAEGEITDLFTVSADMGNYKIHIVKAE